MSVYSTFKFQAPIYCPICGEQHIEHQSHDFEPYKISYYKPGDKIEHENQSLICEEEWICLANEHSKKMDILFDGGLNFLYIVIKKGIYIGIAPTKELAKNLLDLNDDQYKFYKY
jgi:hypothetical protein